ncbi:amphi-Trp domain-containing protein [Halomarina rubra]|uniref:Amphi-Trp domain-containing protein n=1 Tax=Halomarina rubra TaxID=2071873 RepID=A0ABD6AWP2_9EURY|nr:amphi-Trp domain-containing protein [Halomarina rubra]
MAETTRHTSETTRGELAAYLRAIAEEFEQDGEVMVNVGNKQVKLRPAPTVECTVAVEERSPLLGGDTERLTIDVDWKEVDG